MIGKGDEGKINWGKMNNLEKIIGYRIPTYNSISNDQ